MKFTRDSAVWWLLLIVAAATYLSTHFELISHAFPSISLVWESRMELLGALGSVLAAYLRMSPQPLSISSELAGQGADPSKSLTLTGKDKPSPGDLP